MKKKILPFIIMCFVSLLTLKLLILAENKDPKVDFSLASISHASSHAPEPAAKEEGGHEPAGETGAEAPKENPNIVKIPKSQVKPDALNAPDYSESQYDILNNLSKRREELNTRENQLSDKDKILQATESKIDQKLEELKNLQTQVQLILDLYNKKEQENIKSIVKIYESMKPKDAAKIFEELDMIILLQVVENMKEAKIAPILAQMSPQKAKEITVRFAEQKKLKDSSGSI